MANLERKDHTGEVIDEELAKIQREQLIEKYQPKFLGYGGEQIVFSFPNHDSVVAKVHKHKLGDIIIENLEAGIPLDQMTDKWREKNAKDLVLEKGANKELKKYFGKATLQERPYVMKVPVTKTLLKTADQDHLVDQFPVGTHYVQALVRIQEKAPDEAISDEAFSPSARYKEKEILDSVGMKLYQDMNGALLDGRGEVTEEIEIGVGGMIRDLTNEMREDEGLKDVVKDFVENAIRYSEETGEMLDIVGEKNVSFYKKDGKWTYTLIDAKYPMRGSFEKAKEVLGRFQKGEMMSRQDQGDILNMLSYIRSINLLARVSDSDKLLRISERNLANESVNFYNLTHRIFNK